MSDFKKPLPEDEFAKKYNKPGNIFLIVKATCPGEHPIFKGRPNWADVKLQLVITPKGKVVGRIVG